MRKIVYSLIFTLLSGVALSSVVSHAALTPKKDSSLTQETSKTLPQENKTDHQVKKAPSFPRQWMDNMNWLFVHTFIAITVIGIGMELDNWTELLTSMNKDDLFPRLLTLVILPLIITSLAALGTTCLHFTHEENQAKEDNTRLTFLKHYLTYWAPTLLCTACAAFLGFSYHAKKLDWGWVRKLYFNLSHYFGYTLLTFIYPLCFACLIVAPIATYWMDYMKLSPDVDPPKKAPQEADLPSFLTQWLSYSNQMLIYNVMASIVLLLGFDSYNWTRVPWLAFQDEKHITQYRLTYIAIPLIVTSAGAAVSAWISYTAEQKGDASQKKDSSALYKHLLRHLGPALLALACTSFSFFCTSREI